MKMAHEISAIMKEEKANNTYKCENMWENR